MKPNKSPLKKRHAMSEFGTVYGTAQDVRVNRLEARLTPQVPFPHRHAFYHLVFITAGTGWHEIDFQRHEVKPGSLFLMKPGQVHSWRLSAKTKGVVLEFEVSALPSKGPDASLVAGALEQASDFYAQAATTRIRPLLDWMLGEYEGQAAGFEISLRHFLVALLIGISRENGRSLRSSALPDPALDRFIRMIEEHYAREHEVDFYSRKLATTSKALTMKASRTLGKSARSLIRDRLLLEAKRLLAYSELSVAEVGYELGFEDPNYFTRFFGTHVGKTPGEFRIHVRDPVKKRRRD